MHNGEGALEQTDDDEKNRYPRGTRRKGSGKPNHQKLLLMSNNVTCENPQSIASTHTKHTPGCIDFESQNESLFQREKKLINSIARTHAR